MSVRDRRVADHSRARAGLRGIRRTRPCGRREGTRFHKLSGYNHLLAVRAFRAHALSLFAVDTHNTRQGSGWTTQSHLLI